METVAVSQQAQPEVQVDNDRVRITRWQFAPGAETGFHHHTMDYTVVPLSTAALRIVDEQGEAIVNRIEIGKSYFRQAGVVHNVINSEAEPIAFVEIELKSSGPATSGTGDAGTAGNRLR